MGLFKSTKPPPAPLPSLSLHLSNPEDHIFQPDSTVAGHVSLATPISFIPQALEIELWGLSTTWIRTSHSKSSGAGSSTTDYTHYRDSAPLFNVMFNLMPNPYQTEAGQSLIFPFSFRVPAGTGYDRSINYKKPADERWTPGPHTLPPTFFFSVHNQQPGHPDQAEISYGVTTRLICPGVGVGKHGEEPVSATTRILFQPTNPHAHNTDPLSVVRYAKHFTLQSSSLTGQDPSSLGFRQRLHDRFSSETPKLEFEIGIEMPDLLSSGADFRFRTWFRVIERGDKVARIPPIHFKMQKIELLDFTFFRAPRDWNAMNNASGTFRKYPRNPGSINSEQDCYREKKTALNSLPESQIVELGEEMGGDKKGMRQAEQCEFWFSARIPGFVPPSFKSFAITRAYRVKVKLVVEIGEKRFPFEAENHIRHMGGGVRVA